jgi:hypothetical protein
MANQKLLGSIWVAWAIRASRRRPSHAPTSTWVVTTGSGDPSPSSSSSQRLSHSANGLSIPRATAPWWIISIRARLKVAW